ncbi:MAG: glycosyltransferase family 2 protein [Cyanobacteria bacterium SZAS-4]|nr:glycosyltransferase family 2 protein [Cyanobacteria bacterium SZAS-4]
MSNTSQTSVSIIIPVYNSAPGLPELAALLNDTLSKCVDDYEIVLVNDCSKDNSWAVLTELQERYRSLRSINLMRNYGQHNALLCGIRAAKNPIIVTMDDDFQNPVSEIPRLLNKLAEGFDVVYGTPQKEQHGFFRDAASKVTKIALQNAMGSEVARSVSAFRVFRTDLRRAFANYDGPFVNIDVLLTWATANFAAIPVRHEARVQGVSNYTFKKLVIHALNMMTGFSTLPLQISTLNGFLCVGLGAILLAYVLVRYMISGGVVPGFAFLASVVIIFSGAQLLALGVIGEYISRIYSRTMSRPAYVVKEDTELSHHIERLEKLASR